jgi:hypothetical protein
LLAQCTIIGIALELMNSLHQMLPVGVVIVATTTVVWTATIISSHFVIPLNLRHCQHLHCI